MSSVTRKFNRKLKKEKKKKVNHPNGPIQRFLARLAEKPVNQWFTKEK
jgi:hypothetical protein